MALRMQSVQAWLGATLLAAALAVHAEPFAYIPANGGLDVFDTATDAVTANVSMPRCGATGSIIINAAGTRVLVQCYIGGNSDGGPQLVDTATNTVIGSLPDGIVFLNPAGTRAYSGTNTVIDATTNVNLGSLPPGWIRFNASGSQLYILGGGENTGASQSASLFVVDAGTNAILSTVPLGTISATQFLASADGTRVYIETVESANGAFANSGSVVVVDTVKQAVIATIPVNAGVPNSFLLNGSGTRLYVSDLAGNAVSVIDTNANALIARIKLTAAWQITGLASNPAGTRLYATSNGSPSGPGALSIMDTVSNTLIATLPTADSAPSLPQVNPSGTRVYVENPGAYSMSVFDAASNTLLTNVPLGSGATISSPFMGPNVHIAPSVIGTGTITASYADGGAGCSYPNPQFVAPPPGAAPVPPVAPPGIVFPHGLFAFNATGCMPGATLTFIVTYPAMLDPATQYWKYGPTPGNAAPHWYVLPATISGNTATFTITDGGLGDDDLTVNGTVAAVGGPGAPAASGAGGCAFSPQSGWWWNTAEGGRGYFVDMQASSIYFTGFGYTAAGGETWYLASGDVYASGVGSTCVFNGALQSFAGGQTLTGAYHGPASATDMGNVSISFSDATHATASLPGETLALQRYVYANNGSANPQGPVDERTGIYWNPAEGGRGWGIEVQNGVLYMVGYMYDAAGNPAWYVTGPSLPAAAEARQNRFVERVGPLPGPSNPPFAGVWTQYANGQVLGGPYRSPVYAGSAGAMTLQFQGPTVPAAMLTLPTGTQIPIQRYLHELPLPAN